MRILIRLLCYLVLSLFIVSSVTGKGNASSSERRKNVPRSLNFHETVNGRSSSYHVTPAVARHRKRLAKAYREKRERVVPAPPPPPTRQFRHFDPKTTFLPQQKAVYGDSHIDGHSGNGHHHRKNHYKRRLSWDLGGVSSSLTRRQQQNEACGNATITPPGFDGTCAADRPCPNGACCGASNFCGYGDEYCGTGCQSNCDAKAECGPNAPAGQEECPLKVCCSKFGFCGTTDDFCGDNCVGDNCGEPTIPSGAATSVTSRVIGYYEGWASSRPCDAWFPQNIVAQGYTHLYYAFASIDPDSFAITAASSQDVSQYPVFTNLKQANPNLKTYISVGGWAFNDPPTQYIFSELAADQGNRVAFAQSLVSFMLQYAFDGVDIDWEYPGACDRGGSPADVQNYPLLLSTIRSVFDASGHSFGLTFTAPSSYWYLQNFDLPSLLESADWVNLMTYDLHGVWDSKDAYIGPIVQAHTNLTEIKESVQLFLRVDVPLDRVALGLGFYGRSFQLSDPTCTTPGCPFSGPAPAGPCTDSPGILSFSEIQSVLSSSNATPVLDVAAAVKYLVYDNDDWISYDDNDTFATKVSFAKSAGFGGLMVWAADLDTFTYPPGNTTVNSPFNVDDLFSDPFSNGDLTWDLEDDPIDEDAPDGGQGADNNGFGMIAMDGPSSMLTTMDGSSDWVITGCIDTQDLQNVTAFCSKEESDPDSGCGAVFEGDAKNTIVKMPSTCGGSPYARVALLEINNHIALPSSLAALKPESNPVYEFHFDYNFHLLSETRDPSTDGEVLVRVDATNMPYYWAEIDTADPNSAVRRGVIEERWFGGFTDWLSRLNKVESESSADLLISRSFNKVLYSASQTCGSADGTTSFTASVDLSVFGNANLHVRYGFYMQGTIFPTNINDAYVYASSDASASLGFELSGKAKATYSSGRVPIIPQIAWPGLSYYGIVTVGPTFNIFGVLDGSLTASGTFSVTNSYTFPGGRVAWGIIGDPNDSDEGISGNVQPTPFGYEITPQADIQLGGSLSIHVIPEAEVTINVFPGTPASLGALAYIAADGSMNVQLSADLSSADVYVGGNLLFSGGVDSISGSTRSPLLGPYTFYQNDWTIYNYTLPFGSSTATRRELDANFTDPTFDDFVAFPVHELYSDSHGISNNYRRSSPLGSLSCPTPVNQTISLPSELADDDDSDPDDVQDEYTRRSIEILSPGDVLVSTGCSGLTITPPGYSGTGDLGYYDLAVSTDPTSIMVLNYGAGNPQWWAAYNPNNGNPPNGRATGYGREHVFEAQLLTVFMTDIISQYIPPNFTLCTWLRAFVFSNWYAFNGGLSFAQTLASRLPHNPGPADSMPFLNQIANQAK
ncbi:hypothetical protein AcW1_010187 [Taiwanofungus camphoratus]|nr:hypothetical protein AcV5_003075 [Antrodia cinnamomea]KAI0946847.1 hypothetical protein AcW1_010187 [Antrodia cinnamomea]KAI0954352.1 hypothetical protein AcV7_007611 [Antrodia cinnamomea]